ncbi:MAG TPA: LysR family transcriptional regulator [Solirubrobacteraceae bacterium]|nr:LysR family transcriptional regulator [Solirubrobacteraceae bacterium]
MDLQQLRSFAAVAHHAHFTRAAEELHIGQPAVSQHVRRLETELGVELLARTSRSVEITQAGEIMLARIERALGELDAGVGELEELRGLRRGRLTIGAMQSLLPFDLSRALATFRAAYPGVDIRLVEGSGRELYEAIATDRIDVAFAPVDGNLPDTFESHQLFAERLVAIVSPSSPLAERSGVDVADLRDEPFVFVQGGTGLRTAVERAAQQAGYRPRVSLETHEVLRAIALVEAGLGVSVVSPTVAGQAGDRVAVLTLRPALERRVALLWRGDRRPSPAAAAFRDQIRDQPALPDKT